MLVRRLSAAYGVRLFACDAAVSNPVTDAPKIPVTDAPKIPVTDALSAMDGVTATMKEQRKYPYFALMTKEKFMDAFRFAEARSQVFQGPMLARDSPKEWLQREAEAFERGRIRLAQIMGVNPKHFSRRNMKDALEYLLPSNLYAKDARPVLKHPEEIYIAGSGTDSLEVVKPENPGFYTTTSGYHDLLYEIYCNAQVLREESKKPEWQERADLLAEHKSGIMKQSWVSKDNLSARLKAKLSDRQYLDLIKKMEKLSEHKISFIIEKFLNQYRSITTKESWASRALITRVHNGQTITVGRRKNARARVWLRKGTGQFCINRSRTLLDYFPNQVERQQLLYPFFATNTIGQFDVQCEVHGGGPTGQAGALRLAISRGLVGLNKEFYPILHNFGLLIRDPRMVERKKPGRAKARRLNNWKK